MPDNYSSFLRDQFETMQRAFPVAPFNQTVPKEFLPGQGGEASIFQGTVQGIDPFVMMDASKLPKHLSFRKNWKYPESVQPKVPAYAKLPGQLGSPSNIRTELVEQAGIVPSRGKGLQGSFLVNETTTAKRARLVRQGKHEKLDRTGFFSEGAPPKMYEGKQGGGFGELRELDVEEYNEFVRSQKNVDLKGDPVQRSPEGKLQSDDKHFKSALYEAIRRPDSSPTGAEIHKIAKGLADGTMTLDKLKGSKWSKLRPSHKRVLVDGLNYLVDTQYGK